MTSLEFCRKRPESSADKVYRACESKDQTLKKIRTFFFQIMGMEVSCRKSPKSQVPIPGPRVAGSENYEH